MQATQSGNGHPHAMLELREFGCSFGQHVVFQGLNAQIPLQGITILMGPTKTGKSTLMRTLAGQYRGNVHMRQWGDIRLNGVPLEEAGPVPLMRQHVRMLQATVREAFHVLVRQRQAAHHVPHLDAGEWAEALLTRYGMSALSGRMSQAVIDLPDWQRYAFITLAHALTAPSLLLLDEPTFGMKPDSVAALLPLLRNISQHHPLLVSLHNQQEARRLGDRILLIGGGQAVASAPVSEFFTHPVNALADHFIHTGSLDLPSPDAPEEWLTDEGRALRESLHQAAPSGEPASPAVQPVGQPVKAASAPLPEDRVPAPEPEPDVTAPAAEAQEPVPMPAQSVEAEVEAVSASASVPAAKESAVEESVPEHELQADSEAAPAAALPAAAAGESAPAEGAGRRALPMPDGQGVQDSAMVGKVMLHSTHVPDGFSWIVPLKLAGCAQPGLLRPIDYDLDLLAQVGITMLLTLTETDLDQAALTRNRLRNIHFPIYDREAPSITQAYMVSKRIQRAMDQGERIAVHCKAGIGRTGTILACWMIHQGGVGAQGAIERLRSIRPSYVQSREQEEFLYAFEQDILSRLQ